MKPWIFLLAFACSLQAADRAPMAANLRDSASYRWLNAPVLESRPLDDMQSLEHWTAYTTGSGGMVDARGAAQTAPPEPVVVEMALSREQSRAGHSQSIRIRMPTKLDKPGPATGRGWGNAGVRRRFDGEDWSKFNRISLWVFPDCPDAYAINFAVRLRNDGAQAGAMNDYPILRNHAWNHVFFEIDNVPRDHVTEVSVLHGLFGNEPEEGNSVTFFLDSLELQRVEPDYIEGWGVWPGRISYSQAGYQTGSPKSAIASGLAAREFRVIDQQTGETVVTKPVETVKTHLGTFQVMDFSEIRQPGSYVLDAGGTATHPFRIDPNVWRETVLKALNFFYGERCGFAVPGIHGVCHRDWICVHGDKRIVVNGGWHDAGDLTQGIANTGEIVYGMFALAEQLKARGDDPELYDRVLEEAKWGLDWILKTSFGDGYRHTGAVSSRKTDGIIGTNDDLAGTAKNYPMANFVASAAEAIASRVLKESDPRLAAYSLRMAEADWRFAVDGMAGGKIPWTGAASFQDIFRITLDSENVVHEAAATGALASLDLWRATHEQRYAGKAFELGRIVLDSQQRTKPNWDIPFTGFFYTSPAKDRLLHYVHRGREQGPDLLFSQLCEAFPNHPDWMKWYSAVVLHSEYLKKMAQYTEPYGVLPASIYKDDEYLLAPEGRRESFQQQVRNGIALGAGYYLRLFPVWVNYRGHFGVTLPKTQALGIAAHLRGDLDSAQLAQAQLEWIIGRNPFAQSAMWGEGYDYTPLAAFSSGDLVGAIPVGIETRDDNDVPYWPLQPNTTYKEIWVHPVGRWIWLMRDLAGPAIVEGQADSKVEFRELTSGRRIEAAAGRFRVSLPDGKYVVSVNGDQVNKTFLAGGVYSLDLRRGNMLNFDVSRTTSAAGDVSIKITAHGSGTHRFALRTDNLTVDAAPKDLNLQPGIAGTLEWRARATSADTPWVAVVVPDDNLSLRKEATGIPWER